MPRIAGIALSGLLLAAVSAQVLAQPPYTVRGVAAAYQNYLKLIRTISFRAHLNDRLAEDREFNNPRDEEWKIDLAGHRCWQGALLEDSEIDEQGRPRPQYWEQLIGADCDISVSADPKTMCAEGVCDYLKAPADSWKVLAYHQVPLGYLDASGGKSIQRISDLLNGYTTVKWQTGKPVVLTSQTAERRLTLWLDRSKGWMPQRIEYRRLAPATEGYQLTHLNYAVRQASQVGGIWFPSRFTVEETLSGGKTQMPDGLVEREETVVEDGVEKKVVVAVLQEGVKGAIVEIAEGNLVAQVELADVRINTLSDADFRLKATILEGTKVSMQDDLFKEYVWQDGKPVLVVPKPPLFESFYGRQPPELQITDARGVPKTIKLADLRGKWVLLDFWALSCGNCIERSLPEAAKFYREHEADRQRFEILAICARNGDVTSMDDFDRQAAPIIDESWNGQPLPFPVLIDGDLKTFDAYGVEVMPQTLLIDPEGNLVEGGNLKMLAEKLAMPKR